MFFNNRVGPGPAPDPPLTVYHINNVNVNLTPSVVSVMDCPLVVELHFLPGNPYFKTPVLRKRYVFSSLGGSIRRLSQLQSAEVLDNGPAWEEGRDLTVKPAIGGGGGTSVATTRPAASFFALFKKGASRHAFGITGEGLQAQARAQLMEQGLVNEIQVRGWGGSVERSHAGK